MAKRSFSKGTRAMFICDRSGFAFPYQEMVREPGTGLFVHYSESDGMYSRVKHPQNFPPKDLTESIALQWARPDRNEQNANDIFLATEGNEDILWPGNMNGSFAIYAKVSVYND